MLAPPVNQCIFPAGLLCLKTAKSGGLSQWASSVTVHNEFVKRYPHLLPVLADNWYVDRKNEIPPGKLPYFVLPIINYYQVGCRRLQ